MVGKPDKMAARSATQLHSRAITNLRDHPELRLQITRSWWSALPTGLPSPRECRFVVSQVLPLLRVVDDARSGA